MKKLNKQYPNCPLNKKLREIYRLKQKINNSKLLPLTKWKMMRDCECEINTCWRLHYMGMEGYEIE